MLRLGIIKLIVAVLVLCGCIPQNKDNIKPYLSFTFTHITDKEEVFITNNYYYDLYEEKTYKKHNFEYTSQYPLSYYDKELDCVYFTQRKGSSHNDEIYKYDCKTKEEKKISNGIYAVNSMYKISDKENLILVEAASKTRNVKFFVINGDKESIKEFKIDGIEYDDFNISDSYFDYKNNTLYFLGCLESERYEFYNQWYLQSGENGDFEHKIYKYNFDNNELDYIMSYDLLDPYSIVCDGKKLYLKTSHYNGKIEAIEYDLVSKKIKERKDLLIVYDFIGIIDNDLYFIHTIERGCSVVKKMNLYTNEITTIHDENIEGQLNNGHIGYIIEE